MYPLLSYICNHTFNLYGQYVARKHVNILWSDCLYDKALAGNIHLSYREMRGGQKPIFPLVSPRLSIAAKYPCLQLRSPDTQDLEQQCDPVLRFGSVAVGQTLQKHFDIINPSPVSSAQTYPNVSFRSP